MITVEMKSVAMTTETTAVETERSDEEMIEVNPVEMNAVVMTIAKFEEVIATITDVGTAVRFLEFSNINN